MVEVADRVRVAGEDDPGEGVLGVGPLQRHVDETDGVVLAAVHAHGLLLDLRMAEPVRQLPIVDGRVQERGQERPGRHSGQRSRD